MISEAQDPTPNEDSPDETGRGPSKASKRVRTGVVLALVLLAGAGLAAVAKLKHDQREYHAREDARIQAELSRELLREQIRDELADLRQVAREDVEFCRELRARYASALKEAPKLAEAGSGPAGLEEFGWDAFARQPETLLRATRAGDLGAIELLLSLGAEPGESRHGPLGTAAKADNPQLVARLLAAGAKPQGALSAAALGGSLESARLLITAGAKPGGEGGEEYPPLSLSIAEGHLEVARLLLDKGADPNPSGKGRGPGSLARAADAARAPPKQRLAMVELLIERGAEVNSPSGTPAIVAAMKLALRERSEESIAVVAALFKAGATLDPGPTPFNEGDKSFEGGHPPKGDHYYRKPPLLAGFSSAYLGKKVDRKRLYEVARALATLAKTSRPDEVRAQTKATVNRLAQSTSPTDRFLAPGVVGALQPTSLDLRHASRLDKKQLARFVKNHPKLAVLHLGFNEKLEPEDLSVVQPLSELRHLSLGKRLATSEGLRHLEALPGLRSLAPSGKPPGAALARLTQLESLDLHRAVGKIPDLAFLEHLSALKHLDLFNTRFETSELERLAKLSNLRVLSLPFATQDAELEVLLRVAPNLEELRFRKGSRLSDDGLARLATFTKLRLLAHPKKPGALRDHSAAGLERLRAAAPKLQIVEPKDYVSGLELILSETRKRR